MTRRLTGTPKNLLRGPIFVLRCTCRETVRKYEARVQEQPVVIGMASDGYVTLLLSESGRMFGGDDDFLCLIGADVPHGMSKLFNRRRMPELP